MGGLHTQITTEAVAAAGTAFLSEEPSLWRDYEGRENARDRGVLARSNRTVSLSPESSPRKELPMGDLVYAVDVEVRARSRGRFFQLLIVLLWREGTGASVALQRGPLRYVRCVFFSRLFVLSPVLVLRVDFLPCRVAFDGPLYPLTRGDCIG